MSGSGGHKGGLGSAGTTREAGQEDEVHPSGGWRLANWPALAKKVSFVKPNIALGFPKFSTVSLF
jgi:hypothetical protein